MFTKKFFALVTALFLCTIAYTQQVTMGSRTSHLKLGLNIGAAFQRADIKSKLGSGLGATLELAIIENEVNAFGLSLRGRYLYTETTGKDYRKSTGFANNPALTGEYDPRVDYSLQDFVFQNYKSKINQLDMELMITLNRLRRHGILLYGFGGVGLTGYRTYTNQLNSSGNIYDYAQITGTSTSEVLSQLDAMRDNTYESRTENKRWPHWTFAPSYGVGIGFYLSPRVVLGFEHKVTHPLTDLLDGQKWDNNNVKTARNDRYHYTNFYLRFDVFGGGGRSRNTSNTNYDNYTPAVYNPEIYINHPLTNPYTTSNCYADILVTVKNVESKSNIMVRQDGFLLDPSSYDYSSVTNSLTIKKSLERSSTFEITAQNSAGSRSVSITFDCTANNYTPVQPLPLVRITSPVTNPYISADCNPRLIATIENITGKGNIEVRKDGALISSSLYDYNSSSKVFAMNTSLTGSTSTYSIKASNNYGSDIKTINMSCNTTVGRSVRPMVIITNPVGNPYISQDCNANISATISNIAGKHNIEVRQNGMIVNSSLYTYNTSTRVLTFNTPIREITSFQITAINDAGKESASVSIKCEPIVYEPAKPKPVITIINPTNNPHIAVDCKASISAIIANVVGKQNIEVRQNGQIVNSALYSFDYASKILSLNTDIREISTFTITAVNTAGKETASVTIKCEPKIETPVIYKPVITIIAPTANPYISADCKSAISASIANISGKQNIEVRQNGQIVNNTLYSYDVNSKILNLNIPIKEITTFTITAANIAGRESSVVTVKCEPKVEEPVILKPIITIISPNDNPHIAPDCKAVVRATVVHVGGKQNIEVRQNGIIISSTSYTYDVNTKVLSLNSDIKEITTYTFTASNSAGKESAVLTIKCEPKVIENPVTPKPVISVTSPTANPLITTDCKASIKATILNIDGKQNIEVRQNGQIINSSLYSYDVATKVFTFNTDVKEVVAYTITAVNISGKESAVVNIKCEPKEEEVIPKPVITVTTPVNNPHSTVDCKSSIKATILHITGKDNIEVRQNGQIINSSLYAYDAATKTFSFNGDIKEMTAYTITATNVSGKESSVVTIKCEPKPSVTINAPQDNPHVATDCKTDLKATILNVDGKQNIEVRANGQVLSPAAYNYDGSTKLLTLTGDLVEDVTYIIIVSNNSGKDTASVTIKCKPKPVIVVTNPTQSPYIATDCKASISATILNIEGKQNIEVSQNGQIVSNSLYAYDSSNKTFTLNSDIRSDVTYTISASNSGGKVSTSISFKCTPVVPKPIITILNPKDNPHVVTDCKAELIAKIDNIEGKENIGVKLNGQVISSDLYTYSSSDKTLRISGTIKEVSSYTITASNAGGKEAVIADFRCESKVEPPAPGIDNCKCNITPIIASADLYSNITLVAGNANVINVASGQKLVVAPGQSFNGNVNMNGGSLIIGGSANIDNINFNAGDIIILGSANFKNINANNSSSHIKNYGNANFQNITFNGSFENYGTAGIIQDLNVNSSATLINTGVLNISGSLNNNHKATNSGVLNVSVDLKNNGSALFTNNCRLAISKELSINSTFVNYGSIAVSAYTTVNSGKLSMMGGSHLHTGNLTVNSTIESDNTYCSFIKVNNKTIINGSGVITGKVSICDANGIDQNASKSIITCSCEVSACNSVPTPKVVIPEYKAPVVVEEEEKITICHLPPGNTGNPQTISIPKSALKAHLDHGDKLGTCDDVEKAKKEAEDKAKRDAEANEEKVTICHLPPGNTGNPQTISVPKSALKAHLDHGDKLGTCEDVEKVKKENEERLKKEQEDKIKKDAEDKAKKEAEEKAKRDAEANEEKVTICHLPPGNTGNPQTISVPKSALKAHLDHGDKLGTCEDVEKVKKENEERLKKEQDEKIKKEAEDKAKKEAEDKARKEAEEKAKRDAEVNEEKVTICHLPPGNTGNPQTISVPKSALKAHLDHGDKLGTCEDVEKVKKENEERLKKEQEEKIKKEAEDKARQEQDAKIKKEAEDKAKKDAEANEEKVTICHLPPGNTGNPQTISVPKSALKAHLDHGDVIGTCDDVERKKKENENRIKEEQEKKKKELEDQSKREEEERIKNELAENLKKEAEEKAKKEAAERAKQEDANRQAAERAKQEEANRQAAERTKQEDANRQAAERAKQEEANRQAAERAKQEEANRQAAERAKQEEANRQAAERAKQEEANRQAAERAKQEEANRQAAERAKQEDANRQAAERAKLEEANRQAAERAKQEEANRQAAERAKLEEANRQAAERAKQEEANRQAAERAKQEEANRQAAERAKQEEANRQAAERAKQEEANRQAAERAKQEEANRQAAERAKQEEANRQAAERAKQEEANRLAAERAKKEEANRQAAERAKKEEANRLAAEKAKQEADEKQRLEEEEKNNNGNGN